MDASFQAHGPFAPPHGTGPPPRYDNYSYDTHQPQPTLAELYPPLLPTTTPLDDHDQFAYGILESHPQSLPTIHPPDFASLPALNAPFMQIVPPFGDPRQEHREDASFYGGHGPHDSPTKKNGLRPAMMTFDQLVTGGCSRGCTCLLDYATAGHKWREELRRICDTAKHLKEPIAYQLRSPDRRGRGTGKASNSEFDDFVRDFLVNNLKSKKGAFCLDGAMRLLGISRHYLYQPVSILGDRARIDLWGLRSKAGTAPPTLLASQTYAIPPAKLRKTPCCKRACLSQTKLLSEETVVAMRESWDEAEVAKRNKAARQALLIQRLMWADFGGYTQICNIAVRFIFGQNISSSKLNRHRSWVKISKCNSIPAPSNATINDIKVAKKKGRRTKDRTRDMASEADDDDDVGGPANDNALSNLLHAAGNDAFLDHYGDSTGALNFSDLHALPDDIAISVPSLYTTTQQQ